MRMKIVGPDLWASPGVPSQCCRKALRLVSQYHRGDRNYTRLEDRGCGYVKIKYADAGISILTEQNGLMGAIIRKRI